MPNYLNPKQPWWLVPLVLIGVARIGATRVQAGEHLTHRGAFHAALESITVEDLQQHVNVLSDDIFEGREAGTRGGRASATYLQKKLSEIGLEGAGIGGVYFQTFSSYRNALSWREGSDETLKSEFILVGAHYDHIGYGTLSNSYGPIGKIHNGADDNASGVAAILELMEAFARLDRAPKRSVLFAFWDGEEKGLLGSRHWVNHPTVPLQQVKLAVNLDMVGRLREDRLEVSGSRTSWGLRRLLSQHNLDGTLRLDFTWRLESNSDHWPFYERDVPVLLLHTGMHDDYHRPSDDAHLINSLGMRSIVRFLFHAIHGLAEEDHLQGFRLASRTESKATQQILERLLPSPPPRLGVSWDQSDETEPGLMITRVYHGSAADQGGLQVGDRIVRFADQLIHQAAQLRQLVLRSPQQIQVVVERTGDDDESESVELPLTLTGSPVRVGFSWREDEAEAKSVWVTRVIRGSPADQAKLKVGDRIYRIEGEEVAGSEALVERFAELSGPVKLLYERQGRLNSVTIDLANDDPAEDISPETDVR